jgi:hypothetical protein
MGGTACPVESIAPRSSPPEVAGIAREVLWHLKVKGVDFLGAGVAHENGSAIGFQAEPCGPRNDDATKIFEVDDLLDFVIGEGETAGMLYIEGSRIAFPSIGTMMSM